MYKVSTWYLLLFIIIFSCNDDNEFSPENLDNILTLSIENDNAVSDGVEEIRVIAEFPLEFTTESDGMVEFEVFKETSEMINQSIQLVQENGIQRKLAIASIKYNKNESLRVKATISVNNILISEDIFVNFSKAFLETISISSSSLTIQPNSFNEIDIFTQLSRDQGIVSINSIAETVVIDTLGQVRGIFNAYKNKTDVQGKISNRYTLGNDDYQGDLFVISTSLDINNEIKSDTLTIFSQN